MQIKPNELLAYLKRTAASPESGLIWIQGDELVLVEELAHQVRTSKNFTVPQAQTSDTDIEDLSPEAYQREIIIANAQYDWSYLSHATQQKSLFGDKRFFDIRLQTDKLTPAAIKVLDQYLSHWNSDNFILITSQRVDTKHAATKGFKSLLKNMVYIPVWPLKTNEFTRWIQTKAKAANLKFTPNALQYFIEQIEGNLLAAKQEMEKLKLAYHANQSPINIETLESSMVYLAQANIFEVLEKAYSGAYETLPKQLRQLKDEGQLPVMILAAINRELELLQSLYSEKHTAQFNDLCKRFRIFGTKRQHIKKILNRLDNKLLSTCYRLTHLIDQAAKGASKKNSWQLLDLLLLLIAGCQHPNIKTLVHQHLRTAS